MNERGMLMQWLQKFMMGRYGTDPLNFALILLSLVLSIVFAMTPLGLIGSLIAMAPLIWAIVRMFSRNTAKRAAENRAFMKLWNPVKNWFQWLWLSVRYMKKNRYFLCPKCGRIACVPKGTGKVTITCKNCREKYDKKA
jgi:hypothetical protein